MGYSSQIGQGWGVDLSSSVTMALRPMYSIDGMPPVNGSPDSFSDAGFVSNHHGWGTENVSAHNFPGFSRTTFVASYTFAFAPGLMIVNRNGKWRVFRGA